MGGPLGRKRVAPDRQPSGSPAAIVPAGLQTANATLQKDFSPRGSALFPRGHTRS